MKVSSAWIDEDRVCIVIDCEMSVEFAIPESSIPKMQQEVLFLTGATVLNCINNKGYFKLTYRQSGMVKTLSFNY